MKYQWICVGCLIKAGFDPEKVTESCVGRSGKCTCYYCGCVQDSSWFKHICNQHIFKKLDSTVEYLDES